jgi:multicomponent Na+:H+ antiporter subunit E
VKSAVNLSLILIVTWLLWSGYYRNPMLVTLGVLSCIGVVAFVRRMRFVDNEEVLPLRFALYLPWLLWEIVKANVDVARRILDPKLPISPRLIKVKATQKRDLCRVLYANSITLTPGTVSIKMEDDEITVHALTREAAEGVETGVMDAKVTRLEGLS